MGMLSGFTIAVVIHSLKDLYGSSIALAIRSFDPSLFTQLIVYSDAVEIRADFFN